MNYTIKVSAKVITFYIIIQTLCNLCNFKEDDVMINFHNQSQSYPINVVSQMQFTDNFTIINYLSETYIPIFYKSTQEDIYHNVLNHPNFTCYSQEIINCIYDSSNNFKYMYGILGYKHCGILLPEILECEHNFTTTYFNTKYEMFISVQHKYNMKNIIIGLCAFTLKLLCAFLFIGLWYIMQFIFDSINYTSSFEPIKTKYKQQ